MFLLGWHKFQICRPFYLLRDVTFLQRCCWRFLFSWILLPVDWILLHSSSGSCNLSIAWPWRWLFGTSITICQYSGYKLPKYFNIQQHRSENFILHRYILSFYILEVCHVTESRYCTKDKNVPAHAMRAYRGRTVPAPVYYMGAGCKWMVRIKPRPLNPRNVHRYTLDFGLFGPTEPV